MQEAPGRDPPPSRPCRASCSVAVTPTSRNGRTCCVAGGCSFLTFSLTRHLIRKPWLQGGLLLHAPASQRRRLIHDVVAKPRGRCRIMVMEGPLEEEIQVLLVRHHGLRSSQTCPSWPESERTQPPPYFLFDLRDFGRVNVLGTVLGRKKHPNVCWCFTAECWRCPNISFCLIFPQIGMPKTFVLKKIQ